MGESSADSLGTSGAAGTPSANAGSSQKFWEFADIGFDTGKKLWFIQFYNAINENVGTYFARSLSLGGGRASQYQWKDAQGAPFWHVRERFYAAEIERFAIDPTGGSITLVFSKEDAQRHDGNVPSEFTYLVYAYHLSSKDVGRAPMGFVEFYNSDGLSIGRVDNRWLIIEGVDRRTFGEFPNIRLRVERDNIEKITVTRTTIVLQGKPASAQA
jgi:hypothetical protein